MELHSHILQCPMAVPGKQLSHLLIVVRVRSGLGQGTTGDVKSRIGRWAVVSIHHLGFKPKMTMRRHVAHVRWELLVLHVLGLRVGLRVQPELRAHAIVYGWLGRELAI